MGPRPREGRAAAPRKVGAQAVHARAFPRPGLPAGVHTWVFAGVT